MAMLPWLIPTLLMRFLNRKELAVKQGKLSWYKPASTSPREPGGISGWAPPIISQKALPVLCVGDLSKYVYKIKITIFHNTHVHAHFTRDRGGGKVDHLAAGLDAIEETEEVAKHQL